MSEEEGGGWILSKSDKVDGEKMNSSSLVRGEKRRRKQARLRPRRIGSNEGRRTTTVVTCRLVCAISHQDERVRGTACSRRCVAGPRKRREQDQDEVKLMFIDVKKAHFNATCDE